jgi:hypothetical protein
MNMSRWQTGSSPPETFTVLFTFVRLFQDPISTDKNIQNYNSACNIVWV